MVDQSTVLDRAFKALADPTRRGIIASLAETDQAISRLAGPYDMSLAAVSKHVGILADAGLIRRRRVGREHVCSLDRQRLAEVAEWTARYSRFWTERLDALEAVLQVDNDNEEGSF
ncbi:metalloregulator ArsR/SmtB family transcription factor [Henriciella sp. AS95]|uniref:ArsR/SmtB family transcription factor n=1 Tax=Henriciella sp. AS95 TaxID=3135782 RepID=UPI00316E4504